MAQLVKRSEGHSRSRISPKRQVTIPKAVSRAAGFSEGDTVMWSVEPGGRVVLTRVQELLDRYSGAVSARGRLGAFVDETRDTDW